MNQIKDKQEVNGNYKDRFIALLRGILKYRERLEKFISKNSSDYTEKEIDDAVRLVGKMEVIDLITPNANQQTPLHMAASHGHFKIVDAIIQAIPREQKAQVLHLADRGHCTALDFALYNGHSRVTARILEAMTLEERTQFVTEMDYSDSKTVFHIAAKWDGFEEIVKQWIAAIPKNHQAAFLKKKDSHGNTALHYARQSLHDDMAAEFIRIMPENEKLEFINTRNYKGESAQDLQIETKRIMLEKEKMVSQAKALREAAEIKERAILHAAEISADGAREAAMNAERQRENYEYWKDSWLRPFMT